MSSRLRQSRTPTQYEPTRIKGLYIGKNGAGRGGYFVKRNGVMQRLRSPLNTPEMYLEIAGTDVDGIAQEEVPDHIRDALYDALRRAKSRANSKRIDCSLTMDDVCQMYLRQGCVCALSGMAFSLPSERPDDARRGPWAPSIDRINPRIGYSVENSQITTVMANLAKADFAADDFLRMCAETAINKKALASRY